MRSITAVFRGLCILRWIIPTSFLGHQTKPFCHISLCVIQTQRVLVLFGIWMRGGKLWCTTAVSTFVSGDDQRTAGVQRKSRLGLSSALHMTFIQKTDIRNPFKIQQSNFVCPNLTYHCQYYLIVTCIMLVWMRPEPLHVAHCTEGTKNGLPRASMCRWMRQSVTVRWPLWESADLFQRNLTGLCYSTWWLWDFLISHSVQSFVFPETTQAEHSWIKSYNGCSSNCTMMLNQSPNKRSTGSWQRPSILKERNLVPLGKLVKGFKFTWHHFFRHNDIIAENKFLGSSEMHEWEQFMVLKKWWLFTFCTRL